MIKRFFVLLFVLILLGCLSLKVLAENNNNQEISNKYFSFNMPEDTKNTYLVQKNGNGIYIVEKNSAQANMGGFAFGIQIFKNPKDYANKDGYKKIGELKDKKGFLYDMVLIKAREIYYGEGKQIEENYNRLYEFADKVEIRAVNGCKYIKGKGMKGEELYGDVLKKYNKANKTGYVYYDINSDGIDELLIGKISKGTSKGLIYDIYTMVERKPERFSLNDDKSKYFICYDNTYLCKVSSLTKNSYMFTVFAFENNSTKLYPHITFKYDKTEKEPYSVKYSNNGCWEKLSKKDFNTNINLYKKDYTRFDFIPFSE